MSGGLRFLWRRLRYVPDSLTVLFYAPGGAPGPESMALYEAMRTDTRYAGFFYVWCFPSESLEENQAMADVDTTLTALYTGDFLHALATAKYWVAEDGSIPYRPGREQEILAASEGTEKIQPDLQYTDRQWRRAVFTRRLHNAKVTIQAFFRRLGLLRGNDRRLRALGGSHAGQRAFIVANGPSLTIRDLDAIAGEVSFGCNRVYLAFPHTRWRPSYYYLVDSVYTGHSAAELAQAVSAPIFMPDTLPKENFPPEAYIEVPCHISQVYHTQGNPLKYFESAAGTVPVYMIEMALYMGFSEIYLVGVDCSNAMTMQKDHFLTFYRDEKMEYFLRRSSKREIKGTPMTPDQMGEWYRQRSLAAYQQLKDYADARGVKIVNATRGGALEVYPRAALEDVLAGKQKDA